MTDEGAGQVGTYAYDAWGNVTASSGAEANEYKFTSRRWEAAVGLQYNRARFYDPAIGRFISPDPLTGGPDDPTISYFGGLYSAFHRFLKEYVDSMQPHRLNRYVYCDNNPINHIDPLGLDKEEADYERFTNRRRWVKKAREWKWSREFRKLRHDISHHALTMSDERMVELIDYFRSLPTSDEGIKIGENNTVAITSGKVLVVDVNDLNQQEKQLINWSSDYSGTVYRFSHIIILDFSPGKNPAGPATHEICHIANNDYARVQWTPKVMGLGDVTYKNLEYMKAEVRARIVENTFTGKSESLEDSVRNVISLYGDKIVPGRVREEEIQAKPAGNYTNLVE